VRGLKFYITYQQVTPFVIAPCIGAWIEIFFEISASPFTRIAPCIGAWIEIPSLLFAHLVNSIAPCIGAWIEIGAIAVWISNVPSHLV